MSHPELYGGFRVYSTDRSTDPMPLLDHGGFCALDGVSRAAQKVTDIFGDDYDEDWTERSCSNRSPAVLGVIAKAESVALALGAKNNGGSAIVVSVFDNDNEDPADRSKKLAEVLRYVADRVEEGRTRE